MQNSGISSLAANSPNQSPAGPQRKRFALNGRSVTIDPRRQAVRADLADVRLADRVFAPHYAAPISRQLAAATGLRAGPDADSEVLAQLAPGDVFEMLEIAGGNAWGVAPGHKLVGYIPVEALA